MTEHGELLSQQKATELMASVPDWTLGEDVISREFRFENIRESMAFAERVVDLAEEQDHHPDIYISINYLTLVLHIKLRENHPILWFVNVTLNSLSNQVKPACGGEQAAVTGWLFPAVPQRPAALKLTT